MTTLIFDTETTGLPQWGEPSDHPSQPHIVDIACSLFDGAGLEIDRFDAIINPGVEIPADVAAIQGITTEIAQAEGIDPLVALKRFEAITAEADVIVGHNVSFDIRMVRILSARMTGSKWEPSTALFCTMRRTTNICRILKKNPRTINDWKWPTLGEATKFFFNEDLPNAHRARPDCDAAARIYFHLKEQGLA